MNMKVIQSVANDYKTQPRVHRKPKERWLVRSKPYEITPIAAHPVLPGETLDSAFIQARVVTDKVKSNLIGWHYEQHWFYVPLRALSTPNPIGIGSTFTVEMFESLFLTSTTLAAEGISAVLASADSAIKYEFNGGARWFNELYQYIVRTWFRDEDDTTLADLDQWPGAYVDELRESWLNSAKLESTGEDDAELPGVDEQEELDILPGMTTMYAQWEFMRDQGYTDATYRDYLRSYGITPPKDVPKTDGVDEQTPIVDPERLRVIRKWSYPTLAPQPGEDTISNVLYWSIAERIDKAKFFGEPGFVIGVSIAKPKLYLGNQKGHASGMLDSTLSWLPATLAHLPYTSVKESATSATAGILQSGELGPAEDYWVDVKDLFKYGGQYISGFTLTSGVNATYNTLALPTATFGRIPTEAQMDSLFSVTDGSASYITQDGVIHLDLLGKIRETTPR